jgi:hypothetical protein
MMKSCAAYIACQTKCCHLRTVKCRTEHDKTLANRGKNLQVASSNNKDGIVNHRHSLDAANVAETAMSQLTGPLIYLKMGNIVH